MKEGKRAEKTVKDKGNNILLKYLKAYKECFLKKQILIFIVGLIIFLIAFYMGMSTIDFNTPFIKDINTLTNTKIFQTNFVFVVVLSLLLALIPFIKKLSIITIFYPYFMAFNVVNMFFLPTCNKVCLAISIILSILALSLDIVLSFELSESINKRFVNIVNKKNKKKNVNDNIDEKKNKKDENSIYKTNKSFLLITFVVFMLLSIINLIVIKFI